jgi:glycosyltransferase involved in cell wall biosynthesis
MPLTEAAACGLRIIATNGGPTREVLDRYSGWEKLRTVGFEYLDSTGALPDSLADTFLLKPDVAHLTKLFRAAVDDGPFAFQPLLRPWSLTAGAFAKAVKEL